MTPIEWAALGVMSIVSGLITIIGIHNRRTQNRIASLEARLGVHIDWHSTAPFTRTDQEKK